MSVAKQLYQLQEVELELESNEQALRQLNSQLGESRTVVKAQAKLALEYLHLEKLQGQQRSVEGEIEDITDKLATAEDTLYSGRIKNPKELANLQHEFDGLKTKHGQLEDKALEIMDRADQQATTVATMSSELERLEAEWHSQQQQISDEIKQLETTLVDIKHKRELLAAKIEPQVTGLYHELKKQNRQAVAKVEQGVCRGCRISLPYAELQQAKSGNLVQCGSCERILFLA
jgi:hypothetical protein